MTFKIYIPQLNVELESNLTDSKIPSGSCIINITNENIENLIVLLDERFNTISYQKKILSDEESKILDFIKKKFNELKSSDFEYGTMGVSDSEFEYEPTKNIYVKDFFNYLKVEKRENIIENILKVNA
jgi:hypothetical protein